MQFGEESKKVSPKSPWEEYAIFRGLVDFDKEDEGATVPKLPLLCSHNREGMCH